LGHKEDEELAAEDTTIPGGEENP